jgi:hypothetical protein
MANNGQQKRIADKLKRNLDQVLRQLDGLTVNHTVNAAGDHLVEVTDPSWATTDTYALIKIQELPVIGDYSVVGYPVHKMMICVEGDNATLGSVKGSAIDVGYLAEIIGRVKDLGCGIELYVTALGTKPADQATSGGTFNSGSASALKRFIRASVDTIGFGQ